MHISIHAPVKGATHHNADTTQTISISIHAPVKGATSFNERSSPSLVISIHAPVKGATCAPRPPARPWGYFNPRSRKGSDPDNLVHVKVAQDFNPRSRKGSDASIHGCHWR